jgi:RNase P subunit RPR2
MVAKQSSSHIKKGKPKDLCQICDSNLYFNNEVTKRIGLLDSHREITGWICPKCGSEFDLKDNIVYIYGENSIQGKA